MTMLTPTTQSNGTTVAFPDDEGTTTVSAWVAHDGGNDVPTWAEHVVHVQVDTDANVPHRGLVVHLNDADPIYQGDPELHESAAEVLRKVRDVLTGTIEPELDVPVALDIIKRSGVNL